MPAYKGLEQLFVGRISICPQLDLQLGACLSLSPLHFPFIFIRFQNCLWHLHRWIADCSDPCGLSP